MFSFRSNHSQRFPGRQFRYHSHRVRTQLESHKLCSNFRSSVDDHGVRSSGVRNFRSVGACFFSARAYFACEVWLAIATLRYDLNILKLKRFKRSALNCLGLLAQYGNFVSCQLQQFDKVTITTTLSRMKTSQKNTLILRDYFNISIACSIGKIQRPMLRLFAKSSLCK